MPIPKKSRKPVPGTPENPLPSVPKELLDQFLAEGQTMSAEAVESAFKLARAYFKRTGKPTKHKVISRHIAYHGTSMGALSITGLPGIKADFEPLVPSGFKVPNTNLYRAPAGTAGPDGTDADEGGRRPGVA